MRNNSLIKVSGGLGNQLFQLAFAKFIEKCTSDNIYFDVSEYSMFPSKTKRSLYLNAVGVNIDYLLPAMKKTQKFFLGLFPNSVQNLYAKTILDSQLNYYSIDLLRTKYEGRFMFDPNLNVESGSKYIGNFTSPEYWGDYANQIILEVKSLLDSILMPEIVCGNRIRVLAIHARRGDYVTNPKTKNFHGYYDFNYYKRGIDKLCLEGVVFDSVEIFSDDLIFANKLSKIFEPSLVKIIDANDPLYILNRMRQADFFVGSNSTLSWWAAFSGSSKIRVLPSKWFIDESFGFNKSKFFPKSTISIDHAFFD